MKILMVASEVTPFAKTGGLADVAAALPKALKKMGHDVRIIMPFYRSVEKGGFGIRKGRKSLEVEIGGVMKKGLMRWTELGDIPVYLVENQEYFSRDYLYGTPAADYHDNGDRFGFFCRGVLQLLKKMDFRPDVIHCNDWQTALLPVLLRRELHNDPFFARTVSVYTIHNLAYQGLFDKEILVRIGLDWSYFTIDLLEYFGKVSLMKGGILTADIITTVSENYCREIQTEEHGCGLDGVLSRRGADLYGILNGIDEEEWNPATDKLIFKNYTASAPSGKGFNKKALQKLLGLHVADIPLLGMVTRLADQKGLDLVADLVPWFEQADLQLVILGSGEARYGERLRELMAGKANLALVLGFQAALANRIYAGADMFLMPSRYEPCGLGQLIALRYGAVPVVRRTGGLADTVVDAASPRDANGFTFIEYTPEAFRKAIERALDSYRSRQEWKKLMKRGMNADFSWARSAKRYEELYLGALARKI